MYVAAPSGVPIKLKLSITTSPTATRKRRQVESSYCLNYTSMKIHESHREPAFSLYIKWGYDHIKKHNKTYQLLTGDGGTVGLSDAEKAKHEKELHLKQGPALSSAQLFL